MQRKLTPAEVTQIRRDLRYSNEHFNGGIEGFKVNEEIGTVTIFYSAAHPGPDQYHTTMNGDECPYYLDPTSEARSIESGGYAVEYSITEAPSPSR